jgi:phosphate butyryltransferase
VITRVEEILAVAKGLNRPFRVVLAGAENESALETIGIARKRGLVEAILVGDREGVARMAEKVGVDLSDLEIVHSADPLETVDTSLRLIKDGRAEIFFKGQVSTRTVLKGVLNKELGFRTDRILSHVGVFNVPGEHRILTITDAGVNVQPDLTKKKDILLNAVDVAHALGNERPRVAMLSFVEEFSDPEVGSIADASDMVEMYRGGQLGDCVVEGPYSLDVALSTEAARIKGVEGEVAGRADILVMHDIGMGNILYKALLLWCNPTIAGVVMGASIPMIVPSRADSVKTKLNSIALSIMTAKQRQEQPL